MPVFSPSGPRPASTTLFNPKFTIRPESMSTADRTTLGGTLAAGDEGVFVHDSDLNLHFRWSGTEWHLFEKTVTEQSFNVIFR